MITLDYIDIRESIREEIKDLLETILQSDNVETVIDRIDDLLILETETRKREES